VENPHRQRFSPPPRASAVHRPRRPDRLPSLNRDFVQSGPGRLGPPHAGEPACAHYQYLTKHWSNTGQILVKYWSNTGRTRVCPRSRIHPRLQSPSSHTRPHTNGQTGIRRPGPGRSSAALWRRSILAWILCNAKEKQFGQILVKCRRNTRGVRVERLARGWPATGSIAGCIGGRRPEETVKYWSNTGQILVKYWSSAGQKARDPPGPFAPAQHQGRAGEHT
jgi:hypothetical protein